MEVEDITKWYVEKLPHQLHRLSLFGMMFSVLGLAMLLFEWTGWGPTMKRLPLWVSFFGLVLGSLGMGTLSKAIETHGGPTSSAFYWVVFIVPAVAGLIIPVGILTGFFHLIAIDSNIIDVALALLTFLIIMEVSCDLVAWMIANGRISSSLVAEDVAAGLSAISSDDVRWKEHIFAYLCALVFLDILLLIITLFNKSDFIIYTSVAVSLQHLLGMGAGK